MDSEWTPPGPDEIQDLGGSRLGKQLRRRLLQSFASHCKLPEESAYNDEGCLRWLDGKWQFDFLDLQLTQSRDSSKTEALLHALEQRRIFCNYRGLDVSQDALKRAIDRLQSQQFEHVCISGIWGTVDAAKEYIKTVPIQRFIWEMGSTISIGQRFSSNVVLSFQNLLRENDMMIVGQDCNTDMEKMATAFGSHPFDSFIERAFELCDGSLVSPVHGKNDGH
ncbi:ergot alkaloid biosynthetic B [Fusarium mundagurra]|uniref:Ergot alkaloid biosynthetic B n=1 Tax=Fusarium mundagurra TaxID=1567541 RepID=A0A8H6CZN5_9HYPO|nr:ergot alkaloid biosynthetic B [Fusarium mundagurra]